MSKFPIKKYEKTIIYRDDGSQRERESYVLMYETGSIEAWRTPSPNRSEYYGGIEVHSEKPLYDDQPPTPGNCALTKTGTCYHDGSSLAFDSIEHYFGGAYMAIFATLYEWADRLPEPEYTND